MTYSDDLAVVTRLGHRLTFLKSNVTRVNAYIYRGVFAVALSKPVPEPDGWFVRGRRVECQVWQCCGVLSFCTLMDEPGKKSAI